MSSTDASAPAGEVTVSTGDLATTDMVLNIGPQHPATHGVLRLRLTLDGERIVRAEPVIGYMHRGAEKLFEVRDYRQIIVLANRHDWLSAFANELGVVLAVERMLGMEVPVRAVWARTLLAELNRVLNHLMFLGSYPLEVGAIPVLLLDARVPRVRSLPAGLPVLGTRAAQARNDEHQRRARLAGAARVGQGASVRVAVIHDSLGGVGWGWRRREKKARRSEAPSAARTPGTTSTRWLRRASSTRL